MSNFTNLTGLQPDGPFSGLLENSPEKVITAIVGALLTLLCFSFSLGIVWYDLNGYDQGPLL
jgi:hypothetical protein